MNARFRLAAGLIALTLTAPSMAQDFRVQARLADGTPVWELRFKNKAAGELVTIGGAPLFLKSEALTSPPGTRLMAVRYHAGSAGTQSMSFIDRIAILNLAGSKPVILADFMVELVREKGSKREILSRSLEWTKDGKRLTLESFDEEPAGTYTWTGKAFEFQSRDPPDPQDEGA